VIGQLLYCEVVAALVSLADGGSLVVKMFTMYEHHTVAILFLLCCLFEEVEIIKPGTSCPNSGVGNKVVSLKTDLRFARPKGPSSTREF
jgi:23S rRNA U2552 (ribose-2'-O)-methylase RlmE/FtsJ